MLKAVQINLHHSKAASASLVRQLSDEDLDVALIQEPWVNNSAVLGLGTSGKLLYNAGGDRPRAGIVFRKTVKFLPIPYLCTDDLVAAYVEIPGKQGKKMVVCSAYLPGDLPDPVPQLAALVEYCEDQRTDLLLGCDANSHHTSWGSTDINLRGELLNDFFLSRNLKS